MFASRRWRCAALIALLALGAWVVLSTFALLDAGFDFTWAALLPAVFAATLAFRCRFPFSTERHPFPLAVVRGTGGCRAPPAGLLYS